MKTTASEFKKFIDDDNFWPEGAYYEYGTFTVNGVSVDDDDSLMDDDSAVVVIKDGVVVAPARHTWEKDKTCTLDNFFRKWRKSNHVD